MKNKKKIVGFVAVLAVGLVFVLLAQPTLIKAIVAKYKSTDHFVTLDMDLRIKYERPAKHHAITLSKLLNASQNTVERVLNAPFKKPIEVYVCSSQASFNQYVFLSKNARGAVYWGKVFLSPGAFTRGSLAELTQHELTHYLFNTHLGEKAHMKSIPLWFREGIAVFVANNGSEYTKGQSVYQLMSIQERTAFLSGSTDFWFTSSNPHDAVKNGVANWLLYRVGALFLHYLHDLNPKLFDKLVHQLLSGSPFAQSIHEIYGRDLLSLRSEFAEYLANPNNSNDATFKIESLL